ncbi:MAG: hypothetical protein Q4G27_02140, partial [Flavobacteriaceae bacterium]|nr:hypothetical protein [Flavobacteriaceae bacterium]
PIYISLNGLKEADQLDELILTQVLKNKIKQNDKFISNGLFITRNLINITGKLVGKGVQIEDILKGVDFNIVPEDAVLCFDDLERSTATPKDILGYINQLVEHSNIHCLIMSDESQILDENYKRLKEKVIGREFSFKTNLLEIMNKFLEEMEGNNSILFKEKSIKIIDFFNKAKIENLRIFRFFLESLKVIIECIKDIEGFKEVLNELILFTATISIEYKLGNLSIKDLDNKNVFEGGFSMIRLEAFLNDNSERNEDEKSYIEEIKEKYYSEDLSYSYKYFESIFEYILTGHFDCLKLQKEVNDLVQNNEREEIRVYNNLINYNFRELEPKDFDELVGKLLDFTKRGKYELSMYINIYKIMTFFRENKALEINDKDLLDKLKKGMKIAVENGDINHNEIDNFKSFHQPSNDIEKLVISYELQAKEKIERQHSARLLNILDSDQELEEYFQGIFENQHRLFEYIEVDAFYEKFKNLTNKRIKDFHFALTGVYLKKYQSKPAIEFEFFENLKNLLQSDLDNNKFDFPKSLNMKEFIDFINGNRFKKKLGIN